MKIKDFIVGMIGSLILGFIVYRVVDYYVDQVTNMRKVRYQTNEETKEQIRFLRDSFEMEYYKKLLDSTYNFDHSKILNDSIK